MEKKLSQLFDYQRFAGNAALQEVIDSVHERYSSSVRRLDPESLFQVSAAGSPENCRTNNKNGFLDL